MCGLYRKQKYALFGQEGICHWRLQRNREGAIAQAFMAEGAWVIGTRTCNTNETDDACQEWVAVS